MARMTVYRLDERLVFPPASRAEPGGLLAVGGDLAPERLVLAYSRGIFPWPHEGMPLLWFSPDPRMLLRPREVRVTRSLRARLRRGAFELRCDTRFAEVMSACAGAPRAGQDGTWITDAMRVAYGELHARGLAHSVEVLRDGELVGGLYGVSLGAAFFGESMFSRATDASKVAFVALAQVLAAWDFDFLDCQLPTSHLASLGARPCARAAYLVELARALERPTRAAAWTDAFASALGSPPGVRPARDTSHPESTLGASGAA